MAKILVIDDERPNRLLVTTLLRHAGHDVFEAAAAEAGLRVALQARPNLLLVDLFLPDFSGAELIRRLRSDNEGATVPIVLYTASVIDAATRDFMEAYAIRYVIEKPALPETLLQTIESALQDP